MNEAAAQSQKRVEKLDDATSEMLGRYRSIQEQIASIKEYNEQVQKLVNAQEEQKAKLQSQIDSATFVSRGVTPLMLEMIEKLDEFIKLDVPFLIEEREGRVARLRVLMDRPNVSEAEKFRLIMEAYQVENDYGRTIESYQGRLSATDGTPGRDVDFLRIGRIALIYRTRGGDEIGAWDNRTRQWAPLPAEYASSVRQGFKIARKQSAPDLFRIPVLPATESTRSEVTP